MFTGAGKLFLAVFCSAFFLLASSAFATDYIVVLKEESSLKSQISEEQEAGNRVENTFRYAFKGMLLSGVGQADLERLQDDPSVVSVEKDSVIRAQVLASRKSTTYSWGQDRIDQRSLSYDNTISTPSNGYGVDAYVFDSGVRSDHTEFTERIITGYGAMSDRTGTEDCNGHGTHVAGTIAGEKYGIAPEATVIPVRVLDCTGSGTVSQAIDGIDWAIAEHQDGEPAVANFSLSTSKNAALDAAVQSLVEDGVSVAVAAGNNNLDACNYSPASASGVITVGSTTSQDQRSSFSNGGSCVELFAPGSSIPSAWYTSYTSINTISGTSMAAPHAAGAAALLLSSNPSLTPAQVSSALISNATPNVISDPMAGSPNKLLFVGSSFVPPDNDNFADAAPLSTLGGTTANTSGATRETGEPMHVSSNSGASASIWYSWKPTVSGTLALNTQGSNFDTLLAIYTGGSLANLYAQGANDQAGSSSSWSLVQIPVNAGTTYYIAVDGASGAKGQVSLQGNFLPGPDAPSIGTKPSASTSSTSADFSFTGTGVEGATFQCKMDSSAWNTCTSPVKYTSLLPGTHTFKVREVSPQLVYSAEAMYSWTIQPSAPAAPVITAKPGSISYSTGATFSFTGESGATFYCSIDGGTFSLCGSPRSYSGLAYGKHNFSVKQTSRYGISSSTTSYSWNAEPSLAGTSPKITSGPASVTSRRSATFYFTGVAKAAFQCKRNSGSWVGCSSPKFYSSLSLGTHTFYVRQVSPLGKYSSVTQRSWKIVP